MRLTPFHSLKTHQVLTRHGIPCTVILDSAISYILERVDIVLVGCEAVVESGGIVSSIGTAQAATLAKAMGKPFYALAESYKFLRYYPLSQRDLPVPKGRQGRAPLEFDELADEEDEDEEEEVDGNKRIGTIPATPRKMSTLPIDNSMTAGYDERWEMTSAMEENNPLVDITSPDLIDLVITDLGALSPTSVSQYLVAQFSS